MKNQEGRLINELARLLGYNAVVCITTGIGLTNETCPYRNCNARVVNPYGTMVYRLVGKD